MKTKEIKDYLPFYIGAEVETDGENNVPIRCRLVGFSTCYSDGEHLADFADINSDGLDARNPYFHTSELQKAKEVYEKHLASLPKYPVSIPVPEWEGREDIEPKEFSLVSIDGNQYAVPKSKEVEPEEGKEDELWQEVNNICGMTYGQTINPSLLELLKDKFTITRKTKREEGNNDAVEIAKLKQIIIDLFNGFKQEHNGYMTTMDSNIPYANAILFAKELYQNYPVGELKLLK